MNRIEPLLRIPSVTVSVFDHPAGEVHEDPAAEETTRDSISFVEMGAFAVRPLRGRTAAGWSFEHGMLFVTPRGTEFACRHEETCPIDRCLSVAYSAEAVEALRTAGLPPLRLSGVEASPRERFLRRRLRALAAAPGETTDTLRLELLAGALFESVVSGRTAPERIRPASNVVMRRIARAAELIETDYARPLDLRELAGAAEMSPYHFARTFGRLVGMPPHRYLVTVRLREAVRRLEAGASVTATCYAVGFTSPSHFTVAFRRHLGVAPSAVVHGCGRGPGCRRTGLAGPTVLRMSDMSEHELHPSESTRDSSHHELRREL